jgi:hypothetical protein
MRKDKHFRNLRLSELVLIAVNLIFKLINELLVFALKCTYLSLALLGNLLKGKRVNHNQSRQICKDEQTACFRAFAD